MPLTGKTRIHTLIGSPIAQVLAPGWLTERMKAADYDGLLVPLHIEKGNLDTALPVLKAMPNIDSILITLPHKFGAIAHCDRLSGRARLLGAINAMRREEDGRWFGDNFDGAGLAAGVKKAGHAIKGKSVFMVGAGGAGSSIAVSMLEEGAHHLTFHDINTINQGMLFEKLSSAYPGKVSIGSVVPAGCDIVVNATSAGLEKGDPLPIDVCQLAPHMVVADVITDPIPTRLLAEASKIGCATRDGTHMLDGQIELLFSFMLRRS
ncbi:shikimate dehydrogenase [Bradyrhizobium sp. KB893862 SZCCT0404]|uniref:shikimate dehydrogenase family protein n=1 Tax=Bradyrhizobium sp. KB893862 SZCCT0404 TaxID=2807672 RepID=UPI001BA9CD88|nr:shikimate dehydrogenase [Bradyrhizobium sp. KB893862 SZCCT0404]MBR1175217.1 shikimate dehydrogenase [Bradyrhizobium sp. KB893862 SZCCT0404]